MTSREGVPTESEHTAAGRPEAPPAGLRGWALFARVVAWLVVPVYVAGIVANAWLERRTETGGEAPVEDVMLSVGFGMFAVVGAVLVAKRPGNLIGWIVSAAALIRRSALK